ncbi:Beta-glucuronidase [Drechslerella dactyloides]|uniref:Beta-glucuronidase n=1 Tax=Drechslerella dactyloides TaxID=74499 RepID=A0AAD6NMR0_DREDA|nr:Beta-glucuronidase [Drechslerella dactyloides]
MRPHCSAASAFFSLFYVYTSLIIESHALDSSIAINVSPTLQNAAAAPTVDRSLVSYSMELQVATGFTDTDFAKNVFNVWFEKTGSRPSIRLGGSGMDKSTFVPNQQEALRVVPVGLVDSRFDFGPAFFPTIANYFPRDTEFRFGLNLANATDNWKNTVDFAIAAKEGIPQISRFEIGNEVDNFVRNKLRQEPWTMAQYVPQWRTVADELKAQIPGVQFQPAAYAGTSPTGFNLGGIIKAGINNDNYKIPTYSLHFYPQSNCSSGRRNLRLDSLADHSLLMNQLANFDADIAAAAGAGGQFSLAETNSVSCSGAPDVSDTFGSALWLVNYALAAAAKKIERVYIHSTLTTPYAMFIPKAGGPTGTGIRPMAYGMYFLAEALALPERGSDTKFLIQPISVAGNGGDISVYGLYSNRVQKFNPKPAPALPPVKGVVTVITSTIRYVKSTVLPPGVHLIVEASTTQVPKSPRPVMITTTTTRTITLTTASTRTWVSKRVTTITTTINNQPTPNAAPVGKLVAGDGNYLARAVVLNLARFNTSDPAALNCRSCPQPGPAGFGTIGARPKPAVKLSGFQPGHTLKLLRLQAPGLNAKSGVNVSGLQFNDDNGSISAQAKPESLMVNAAGEVNFNLQAAEGVLLVDQDVK